ncbi:VOC family protein [Bradyrhizobium diazoefficiens]|nr:VOC family protein [Bradyrhizobium diazoefficiens]MBR0776996.1 VOC family protein [Bradyrhizobium diazoefficiens]
MPQHLSLTAVVVRDYDEAIAFFVGKLGFELREDTRIDDGKRWVVVAPPGSIESGILLARAANPGQAQAIGNQSGGRVFLFLATDDFDRDYEAFRERGVRFLEAPRREPYGTVAVFEDLYGNRWDLIERAPDAESRAGPVSR